MHYTTRSTWRRVSRANPCPICGRPDWCLYTGPPDSPDAAICARIESDRCVGSEGAGWLHRLRNDDGWRDRPRQRRVTIEAPPKPAIDFRAMAAECYRAMTDSMRWLAAEALGVSVESLRRLGVGWSTRYRATTWPMREADRGDISEGIIGIRLRAADGRKWSMRGSRQGLFLPYLGADDYIVVCEGATDCAALLDLSFEAVGRPSCSGGVDLLVELVRGGEWRDVVILADADRPGQRGAERLAMALVPYVGGVRIVTPPPGVKDAREWVRQGATRDDLFAAIGAAPVLQLRVVAQGVAR